MRFGLNSRSVSTSASSASSYLHIASFSYLQTWSARHCFVACHCETMVTKTAGSCGVANDSPFCSKAISLMSYQLSSHIRGKTEVDPSCLPSMCLQDSGCCAKVT